MHRALTEGLFIHGGCVERIIKDWLPNQAGGDPPSPRGYGAVRGKTINKFIVFRESKVDEECSQIYGYELSQTGMSMLPERCFPRVWG